MELSTSLQADINLAFITADAQDPKHLNMELPRAKLESLGNDPLDALEGPCKISLKDAHIAPGGHRRSHSRWWDDAHAGRPGAG